MFRDYLRYLERRFDHAPKLRARAVRKLAAVMTTRSGRISWRSARTATGRLVDDDVGVILQNRAEQEGVQQSPEPAALMEETIPERCCHRCVSAGTAA